MRKPSAQNAIDLFSGEWTSKIPFEVDSGHAALFHDGRLERISQEIGGFEGKTVLELGPLEGGHTYMMLNRGAARVDSIEANSRAFVKCLIVKDLLKMDRANYTLGNFDLYLEDQLNYDFILAFGVIYHCRNPVETIVKLCRSTNSIGIWSHYFEENAVRPIYGDKFNYEPEIIEYDGFKAPAYVQGYGEALDQKGFCGGGGAVTRWLPRQTWFDLFAQLGFRLDVLSESTNHQHGPEFTAIARRV